MPVERSPMSMETERHSFRRGSLSRVNQSLTIGPVTSFVGAKSLELKQFSFNLATLVLRPEFCTDFELMRFTAMRLSLPALSVGR